MTCSDDAKLSVAWRTLAGMGISQSMPDWVQRSRLVVAGTEDFLLWVFGQTGSPEALGSRVSLAWLMSDPGQSSPMIHRPAVPTQSRAGAEFMIASAISTGEAYPPPDWWTGQGIDPNDVPPQEFWDAHAGYAATRSYARGVAVALGWAYGVIDNPALMTPVNCEDGSPLSDEERQGCAQVLHALSVRPLPVPPRPLVAARQRGGEGSWLH